MPVESSLYREYDDKEGNTTEVKYIDKNYEFYPDKDTLTTFGPVILPKIYGSNLSELEIASDGKISLTVDTYKAFDISATADYNQIQGYGDKVVKIDSSHEFRKIEIGSHKFSDVDDYELNETTTTNGFRFDHNLQITSNLNVLDSTVISKDLAVGLNAVIQSNLTVHGDDTVLNSTLSVAQDIGLSGVLSVGKNAFLASNLTVYGDDTVLDSTLTVAESTILSKNLSVGSNLSVANRAYINGALSVTQATHLGKDLYVGSNAVIESNLTVRGTDTVLNSRLSVADNTLLSGTLSVSQEMTVGSNLRLTKENLLQMSPWSTDNVNDTDRIDHYDVGSVVYNTQTSQFLGLSGPTGPDGDGLDDEGVGLPKPTWKPLGGGVKISDADGNTTITTESAFQVDENLIQFMANDSNVATMSSNHVEIRGSMNVVRPVTFASTLEVAAAVTASNDLRVIGLTTLDQDVVMKADLTVDKVTQSSNLIATNSLLVHGAGTIDGVTKLGKQLEVNYGGTNLDTALATSSLTSSFKTNLSVGAKLKVEGDTNAVGRLTVGKSSDLDKLKLKVQGTTMMLGTTTMESNLIGREAEFTTSMTTPIAVVETMLKTDNMTHLDDEDSEKVLRMDYNRVVIQGNLDVMGTVNNEGTTAYDLYVEDKAIHLGVKTEDTDESNETINHLVQDTDMDHAGIQVMGTPKYLHSDDLYENGAAKETELKVQETNPQWDKSILWNNGGTVDGMKNLGYIAGDDLNKNSEPFWEVKGGPLRITGTTSNVSDGVENISFGFRINSKKQLELTKLATDGNLQVIAKFGAITP